MHHPERESFAAEPCLPRGGFAHNTEAAERLIPGPSLKKLSDLRPSPSATENSTLFTPSPFNVNMTLPAPCDPLLPDAQMESGGPQARRAFEAINPYATSIHLQNEGLDCPNNDHLWIFATRIFFPQIYLHFSFRLPWLYWARVVRIFQDAEMAMEEVEAQIQEGMLDSTGIAQGVAVAGADVSRQIKFQTRRSHRRTDSTYTFVDAQGTGLGGNVIDMKSTSDQPIARLTRTWDLFIDSLLKEWKTLNFLAVLLLSAIVAMLQIESAAAEFAVRTPALASAICALMSLLYGCIYSIRFFEMKKIQRALEWANKAKQSALNPYWNPWVFLSLPIVWLAWSIMLFTATVMAYIWRTDGSSGAKYQPISPSLMLASRLILTSILIFGLVHLFLAIWSLVEWDYAKLDTGFHETIRRSRVSAGKQAVTGGASVTQPLYKPTELLDSVESDFTSEGEGNTSTTDSQANRTIAKLTQRIVSRDQIQSAASIAEKRMLGKGLHCPCGSTRDDSYSMIPCQDCFQCYHAACCGFDKGEYVWGWRCKECQRKNSDPPVFAHKGDLLGFVQHAQDKPDLERADASLLKPSEHNIRTERGTGGLLTRVPKDKLSPNLSIMRKHRLLL